MDGVTRSAELGDRVRSLRLPPPQGERGRSRWLLWLVVIVLTSSGAWFAAYAAYSRPAAREQVSAAPGDLAETNTTQLASAASPATKSAERTDIALESKGYIVAAHQVLVSPKVSGMIVRLGSACLGGTVGEPLEGQRFKAGDIIAELEKTDYEADWNHAQATVEAAAAVQGQASARLAEAKQKFRPQEIDQAHEELQEAVAQQKQLKAEYERSRDLNRRGKIVTDQDLEVIESKHEAMAHRVNRLQKASELVDLGERLERIQLAEAEAAQATAQYKQAQADLAKAKWRLDNCTIRAPISGTILKKNAEVGNIVNPIAFNGSYSICDIADLSDLEVEVTVQERDIGKVQVGQSCTVQAEAFPDRNYRGVVSRLMPIADRAKAAIPVRVKLTVPAAEEGIFLKPEMGAMVWFHKHG